MRFSARWLPSPSETQGARAPAALVFPVLLVVVAGCSALTRVPPHAAPQQGSGVVQNPAPAGRSSAPGAACGPLLQVKPSASAPLGGRLPLVAGLTITDTVNTPRGYTYRGFLKGTPSSLSGYLAGAEAGLRAGGYTVRPGVRTGRTATSTWAGKNASGSVSVAPLCTGFVGLQYIVNSTG